MEKDTTINENSLKDLVVKGNEWLTYLKTKFKIILICAIIGAALGFAYAIIKKPVYVATLSFGIEDDKVGGSSNIASQLGLDIGAKSNGLFNGQNLLILLKSRSMIENALLSSVEHNGKLLTLMELHVTISKAREKWSAKPYLKNVIFPLNANRANFARVQDSILGVTANVISLKSLTVNQLDKKSSIVDIEFKSQNEKFAKLFVDNLIKVVSDYYVSTKSKKAKNNLDILVRQTDSIRGVLNGNISSVAVANDNTFALNPAMNVRRVPSARKQVDVQANTLILSELVKQCEVAKVNLRKETPLIQIIDPPILPLKVEKVGKLKGLILGGFLGGFLIVIFFIAKRFLQELNE